MTEGYVHVDVSQNFRMSELEAAWLRIQLPHLAAGNRRRAEIARHYRSVAPHLRWQADHADHVYHLCVARVSDRSRARSQLADGRCRHGSPVPGRDHPTARLPRAHGHTVSARRAMGRRVHERAVLPGVDRRGGRDDRRRLAAGRTMTLRNPSVRTVSAFFPCYNDEHAIPIMVRSVRAALIDAVEEFEIIVVDDGSRDGSVAVLESLRR